MKRYFVGITGASGHPYATRLVRALLEAGHAVDLSVTGAGEKVLRHEQGIDLAKGDEELARWLGEDSIERVRLFASDAIEAPPSSGTGGTEAVILCPCSMGTLARVAAGFSSNLVERAADVALKENRTLVLVPRETPLSAIHLENLLKLARMGACVLPAMPGFYQHPRTLDDAIDHVVGKVFHRIGLEYARGTRWTGQLEPPPEPGIEPPGVEE